MMGVTAERVGAVMALSPAIRSLAALDAAVRDGLPVHALWAGAKHIARSGEEHRVLIARILRRGRSKRQRCRLTPPASEKTERLARVFAMASLVWCNDEDARDFLNSAHPLLDGRCPVDVAMTELGARRVQTLLSRLCFGMSV